jgi:hypothetical protein
MSFTARDNFHSDTNFMWFYRKMYQNSCTITPINSFYSDKIGISKDFKAMIHNDILYLLSKLGEKEAVEPINYIHKVQNTKVKYIFYRVGSKSDLTFSVSPVTLLYLKFFYTIDDGKLMFAHVGYLGDEFRKI